MFRTTSLVLITGALAATACTEATPSDDVSLDRDVASLATKHGVVRFIADGSGGVAVLERGARAVGAAEWLLERDGATPLEVFLALAPDDLAVPPELEANHAALRGDDAPRALAVPLADAVEGGFTDCTDALWAPWHADATASYDGGSALYLSSVADITEHFYINDQHRRRFDACTASAHPKPLTLKIFRKTNAGAWQVAAPWEKIGEDEHFFFTSMGGTFPDWRMTATRPTTGIRYSYGVAGAWSDESIGFGGGGE